MSSARKIQCAALDLGRIWSHFPANQGENMANCFSWSKSADWGCGTIKITSERTHGAKLWTMMTETSVHHCPQVFRDYNNLESESIHTVIWCYMMWNIWHAFHRASILYILRVFLKYLIDLYYICTTCVLHVYYIDTTNSVENSTVLSVIRVAGSDRKAPE